MNDKFEGWHPKCVEDYHKAVELAEVRAELKAKLQTALLMSKLRGMSDVAKKQQN